MPEKTQEEPLTTGCGEICWTRVDCPECGSPLWPRGRSMPIAAYECSHAFDLSRSVNTCHLFNEHDSDRYYFDKAGWAAHQEECEEGC